MAPQASQNEESDHGMDDEIEKWADLKEKGLISEAEYQAKKRALMKT